MDIKGDWDGLSSSWTANMVVNSVPASSILENDWKKHVQGSVSGGVDLRGGRDGVTHVAGLVRLQDGMLTGLPVLDRLALFCGSSRFQVRFLVTITSKLPSCMFSRFCTSPLIHVILEAYVPAFCIAWFSISCV